MKGRKILAVLIIVVGIAALAVGVIYLAVPAHSLPSWFPGHFVKGTGSGKHSKRGIAGVAAGAVLIVIGAITAATGRRRHTRY